MSHCAKNNLTQTDFEYLHKLEFEKSWAWWLNHAGKEY
jgi:hypothetical protein